MKPSISAFFPAYNDGGTISAMVINADRTLRSVTDDYEVIVVNDGSKDYTPEMLEELQDKYPRLRVVHHVQNRGYGGALRSGFDSATKDLIFYTDGDAQYDPRELRLLLDRLTEDVDVVQGYKIARNDPLHRKLIGRFYHWTVRTAFGLRLRDVDCDFRLIRRTVFDRVELTQNSGCICVELMKKIQDAGFRIVEVPVHHYHRAYGGSQFFNFGRVARVGVGLLRLWRLLVWEPRRARESTALELSGEVMAAGYEGFYSNRRVMITGGLGFIGSNLARRLVDLGSEVLLVDSLIPDYGGTFFNVAPFKDRVRVNVADVRTRPTMNYLVQGQEVIFNLAGQVSHIDSMRDPYDDMEINCRSQLTILEACRHNNPSAKVVYASTRQIYGRPDYLPVDEAHLVRPTDVNGINKAAGERYHIVYNDAYGVRATSLRLTNTYGPRQLMKHNRQGFIGWFIRLALEGQEIQLFGNGSQLRDLTYVDDAVEAFLLAGASDAANGQVFNLGGVAPVSLRELVELLLELAGSGSYRLVPFPDDKKVIDIGSFYADCSKIKKTLGWEPRVGLREGLAKTLAYYRENRTHYW